MSDDMRLKGETYRRLYRDKAEDELKKRIKKRVQIKKRLKKSGKKAKSVSEVSATSTSLDRVAESAREDVVRNQMRRADEKDRSPEAKAKRAEKLKKEREKKKRETMLGIGQAIHNVRKVKNDPRKR